MPARLALAAGLAVQLGLFVFQIGVVARQERNLQVREASLQRMSELAERITTGLERTTRLAQTISDSQRLLVEPPAPEPERPVVLLPISQ